jgi:adenylylsulfate reductase, subunit B
MSIMIDKAKCKGCGMCTSVCPGSLIYQDSEQKAFIKYPKDCWGCASCIKECHFGAIALYLGADIGGMGSLMTVKSAPDTLTWDIKKRDGSKEEILINKKESRYSLSLYTARYPSLSSLTVEKLVPPDPF